MKALDLFCGGGGAAVGLHRAGYDVVGVDIVYHRNYPFRMIRADAMRFPLDGYDLLWASPPCQRYSTLGVCRPGLADRYPDYIDRLRLRLRESGIPYIIENVPQAPLVGPVLCGSMFGLGVRRHRKFESWPNVKAPEHKRCVHGGLTVAGHLFSNADGRRAMGIDWRISNAELAEAVPPAYSAYMATAVRAMARVYAVRRVLGD